MKEDRKSADYRDYVIKDGAFIGAFEEMYKHVDDPWHIGEATALQYDLALQLLDRYHICSPYGRMLDIGCGKGSFTARLKRARPHASILGVDISPTAIRSAREKHAVPGLEFDTMDLQKEYTLIDEQYDIIIIMSQLVWYILPNLRQIISHLLTSAIREEGYLLINQSFLKPEEQTYGKEIVSSVEDLIELVGFHPVELIETNRFTNHNAIFLFKNGAHPAGSLEI